MSESRCEHTNEESRDRATASDYEVYFEIPKVSPGSDSWRESISHLIADIAADVDVPRLSESDTTSLIDSLRSVRELTAPGDHQLEK